MLRVYILLFSIFTANAQAFCDEPVSPREAVSTKWQSLVAEKNWNALGKCLDDLACQSTYTQQQYSALLSFLPKSSPDKTLLFDMLRPLTGVYLSAAAVGNLPLIKALVAAKVPWNALGDYQNDVYQIAIQNDQIAVLQYLFTLPRFYNFHYAHKTFAENLIAEVPSIIREFDLSYFQTKAGFQAAINRDTLWKLTSAAAVEALCGYDCMKEEKDRLALIEMQYQQHAVETGYYLLFSEPEFGAYSLSLATWAQLQPKRWPEAIDFFKHMEVLTLREWLNEATQYNSRKILAGLLANPMVTEEMRNNAIFYASQNATTASLQLLLKQGASVQQFTETGESLFSTFIGSHKYRDARPALALLQQQGANIDQEAREEGADNKDEQGALDMPTALYKAVVYNYIQDVDWLLAQGANPMRKNRHGLTMLDAAQYVGNTEMAAKLTALGVSSTQKSPLMARISIQEDDNALFIPYQNSVITYQDNQLIRVSFHNEILWRYHGKAPLSMAQSAPLVFENTLYFADGDNLIALSLENGQLLWQQPLSAPVMQPIQYRHQLYIADRQAGHFYQRETGKVLKTEPFSQPLAQNAQLLLADVENGKLYFNSTQSMLYILALNEQKNWLKSEIKTLPTTAPVLGMGIYQDFMLLSVQEKDMLLADTTPPFHLKTLLWTPNTPIGVVSQAPIIVNNKLYLFQDHYLRSIELKTKWAWTPWPQLSLSDYDVIQIDTLQDQHITPLVINNALAINHCTRIESQALTKLIGCQPVVSVLKPGKEKLETVFEYKPPLGVMGHIEQLKMDGENNLWGESDESFYVWDMN